MERLLKIVEGPMRGAEIALVTGTRIKVGRGEDCDIVIADASLAETAFELDVAESAVTLITPDGAAREMKPFEIHTFGTTAFASGFADAPWEELRLAQMETSSEPVPPSTPPAPSEEPAAPAEEETKVEERKNKTGCVCWGALLLILLLLVLGWFFRGSVAERVPQLKPWIERTESPAATSSEGTSPVQIPVAVMTLKTLAAQHGLAYSERDGRPVLTGNLTHRSERLAIRALALAADRRCILDLSDDETLASSTEALLFTVTEGALKVSAATNRTVVLSGYAPTAAALGAALKALRVDVPWVNDVDVGQVMVGGPVPDEQKDSAFAVSGALASTSAASTAAEAEPAAIQIADVNGRKLPRNMFPVAGILTRPYPCVVLRDGHRIVEGGQLGSYTVVRIGADLLELKQGEGQADWEP